jgi:hypothetical protein
VWIAYLGFSLYDTWIWSSVPDLASTFRNSFGFESYGAVLLFKQPTYRSGVRLRRATALFVPGAGYVTRICLLAFFGGDHRDLSSRVADAQR